ncbi:MAG: helix-turn-helix domain-containing protein [Planctomycetaceae bacterium]|jgi:excisionase family DNA binding protein
MATEAKFLTVKETAETLGISPNTVRAWGASGKLPEYRHPVNNYRLFKENDVERLRAKIAEPVLRTTPKTRSKKRRAK